MDQTTIINTTSEFLQSQIKLKDERIAQLEESHQRIVQRDYATAGELSRLRNEMQEYVLEELDLGGLSESQAESIADICGFELTKEFEVEVTVQYSVTVNARTESDALNAVHEIDFDSVSYNSDEISYLSSSIDRVDI